MNMHFPEAAPDVELLKAVAEWRVERARQKIAWATHDRELWLNPAATLICDTTHAQRFEEIEDMLAETHPTTARIAHQLLRMTITILSHVGAADDRLAQGHVLQIVQNVAGAIAYLPDDLLLGTADATNDKEHLRAVSEWRIARAEQEIAWAKAELAQALEADAEPGNTDALRRMEGCQSWLCEVVPATPVLARELLLMAAEIIGYEGGPSEFMGQGPTVQIVRNVATALGKLPPLHRIGPALKQ